MRARELISKDIRQGLKRYRDNRDNQKTVKWDKEADRQAIFDLWEKICEKNGWNWCGEACCGTFWLSYKGDSDWSTIKICADTPNLAKYVKINGRKIGDGIM